ncbi:MAG: hypothetical protein GX442_08200 [Candidatus Riflebacteria bacterium]|nr:hypothetical protein [Candidatus Riflebacteria bacterium]
MEKIDLTAVRRLLRGLLNGSLEIVSRGKGRKASVKAGKANGKGRAAAKAKRRKPGRKPMSPTARAKAQLKAKRAKIRAARQQLPQPRQVFEFLHGKTDGAKLSVLAKHFGARRSLLKVMLGKLVDKQDLDCAHEVYYLKRRIRKGPGVAAERKAPPVKPAAVLDYLKDHPGATLVQMTKKLGAENYQKLIKVINLLKKEDRVKVEGKAYSLT